MGLSRMAGGMMTDDAANVNIMQECVEIYI